jgi:hypothetical protein
VTHEQTTQDYIAIRKLIQDHMKWTQEKADLWMRVKNPLLGGVEPMTLISLGRGHKLRAFVECCESSQRLNNAPMTWG